MTRIGQILIREQLATENSVARALGVQHFAGGRLGTLLLERGSVAEDELGRALAIQHGCEYIPWQFLGNVTPAVIACIPGKFAVRHAAIPYELAEGWLRVALRDPADLRILDELFFVTGRKIIPAVAPEVRIYQGLEKYYGERRTPRFAILAEKLSRPSPRAARPSSPAAVPPSPSFFGAPPSPSVPPPPDFSENASRPSGPLPHEVWGDGGEEGAEPPIIQSWHIRDLPSAPWAASASSEQTDDEGQASEAETISWEEMAPSPHWIPEEELPSLLAERRASERSFLSPDAPAAESRPHRTGEIPRSESIGTRTPPANPPVEGDTAHGARSAPLSPAFEEPRAAPMRARATPPPAAPPRRPSRPSADWLSGARGFDFSDVIAARDRDAIGQAALGAMSQRFLRAALFAAKPDFVSGWSAAGEGVRDGSICRVEIPWTEPSVFLNVRLSRSFYLGPLPPLSRHRDVVLAMGGAMAQECLVQPVFIKEKPVAFLYAEFAPGRGATPLDLAFVRELAAATAAALAASIRLKKKSLI